MINQKKFALSIALFAAVMHLIWSLVVLLGFGQRWVDFATRMHFMSNPITVMPFTFAHALGLIVMAFVVAYIVSSIFALIWNNVHKR